MSYDRIRKIREQSILDASKICFFKNGILNTTIKDISDEAKISRQTFYKYFTSIEELIYCVQFDCMKHLISYITDFEKNDDEFDMLKKMLVKMVSFCDEYPDEILYISTFDIYRLNHQANENFEKEYFNSILNTECIEKILKNGQAKGTIRSDIDINIMISILTHTTLGLAQRIIVLKEFLYKNRNIEKQDFFEGIYDMLKSFLEPKK